MRKLLLSIVMLAMLSLLVIPVMATPTRDRVPRLDEMYFVVKYPEAQAMTAALAGEIDSVVDMIDPENVITLRDNGWSISANPGFHMCYLGINCRDYAPDTAGYFTGAPYGERAPGFPLYPLNLSEFRLALHYLIGDKKDAWIAELYQFINVRLDTCIPPASIFWYNPEIPPVPYDPDAAYDLLTSLGFSNDTGIWIMPNGEELRKIYVMSPSEAPPSVTLTGYCVDAWNEFFGVGSDDQPYFIHVPVSFYDEVAWVFYNRDFDIYFLCWGLSRDPDYLYNFFHPDMDFPWGDNSPGINVPELNDLLYAIKHWRWPNGTYIETMEEMKEIVYEAQWYVYYLTPYIPLYSRRYHNAWAPGLQCWVESLGYGSDNGYTYYWINWRGAAAGEPDPTKPSMKYHVAGPIEVLSPGYSDSAYEYQILGRLYDGLMDVNPFTHEDIMWAAKSYSFEPWSDPDQGVEYGMKITFTLRSGITWHDGEAVTSDDCIFGYEFMKSVKPPEYADIWATYISSNKINDYTFEVYVNATGIWYVYTYAGLALIYPPQIWGPHGPADANDDGVVTPEEAEGFDPAGTPHPTVEGLTCLIGTGPWIFDYYDDVSATAHIIANENYWAKNFLREDFNFDGKCDMKDIINTIAAFGTVPGDPRWYYGQADVNCDYKVDMKDIIMVIGKFGSITLPG